MSQSRDIIAWLRTPAAIRERCNQLYAIAERDGLAHFALRRHALEPTASLVTQTIIQNYPDLAIPYHSRWRHFEAAGIDRWRALTSEARLEAQERARAAIDLCVVSVLLDAGAGAQWTYKEPATGLRLARSEGLAVASFNLFCEGVFSSDTAQPLRADADSLSAFTADALARAFQAGPGNALSGLEGRAALLCRLGECMRAQPRWFGDPPRIGNLYDHFAQVAVDGAVAATTVLAVVVEGFADIWPGRIIIDGVNLGDVWRHPKVRSDDLSNELVPFHKLSQWLTYSLFEPLEEAGIRITGIDELTGLAEYRNGGLFIDSGVLEAKHANVIAHAHLPQSEIVVEWRALTIALLDRVAALVRAELGQDADSLPLAKVLEGGTWSAGRALAKERRRGGVPPIAIVSDGTVF